MRFFSESFVFQVGLVALSLLTCMSVPAEEAPLTDRERTLIEMVQRLESRVEALEKRLDKNAATPALPAKPATPTATAPAVAAPSRPEDMRAYWEDGLHLETMDRRFELRIGGRFHNDWAWFGQDPSLKRNFGNSQDGVKFRRSRLFLSGVLYENVGFKVEYDFAGGDADFTDVYMNLPDLPVVGELIVGHQREPFGFEVMTGANYLTFMERGLPVAFTPIRNTGALIRNDAFDERMTWAVGAFRTTDEYGEGSDDGDYSVTGRVTGVPWYEEGGHKLVHLGAAYSHRPRNGALRVSSRPEAQLSDIAYLDTGLMETDNVNLFGLEGAIKLGSLSLQGEYIRMDVDAVRRRNFQYFSLRDEDDVTFDGFYAAASYFLTGEERPYVRSQGAFSRVHPKRNFSLSESGWGAFELALRYSNLDLDDGPIYGGTEDNWTVGLNWYLNPHARMMLNYVHGSVDRRTPVGAGGLFHTEHGGEIDIVQTRFQFDF